MLIENAGVKGTSSQLNFKQDRPTADHATFKSYVCSIGMFVDALIKIGLALYRQPNMQWHC